MNPQRIAGIIPGRMNSRVSDFYDERKQMAQTEASQELKTLGRAVAPIASVQMPSEQAHSSATQSIIPPLAASEQQGKSVNEQPVAVQSIAAPHMKPAGERIYETKAPGISTELTPQEIGNYNIGANGGIASMDGRTLVLPSRSDQEEQSLKSSLNQQQPPQSITNIAGITPQQTTIVGYGNGIETYGTDGTLLSSTRKLDGKSSISDVLLARVNNKLDNQAAQSRNYDADAAYKKMLTQKGIAAFPYDVDNQVADTAHKKMLAQKGILSLPFDIAHTQAQTRELDAKSIIEIPATAKSHEASAVKSIADAKLTEAEISAGLPQAKANHYNRPQTVGISKEELLDRRDIATRLRDAQRGHQAALKTGDPDAINQAIGMIENLNEAATASGVKPLPVPNRIFTNDENTAIRLQAVKNLEAQRGKVSSMFGVKPSIKDVGEEVQRLKRTLTPGKVSFDSPAAASPAPQTGTPSAHDAMPPADKHSGRIIRDTVTGKRYRSTGSGWAEVQ